VVVRAKLLHITAMPLYTLEEIRHILYSSFHLMGALHVMLPLDSYFGIPFL